MYCHNCGTVNESNAHFCAQCGTQVRAFEAVAAGSAYTTAQAAQSWTPVTTATAGFASTAAPIQAETYYAPTPQATAAAFANELGRRSFLAEAQRLRKSLQTCRIVGAVLILFTLTSLVPMIITGSPSTPIISALGTRAFLAGAAFFLPYGFAPIAHWVGNHGFFAIFTWVLLLAALIIVLTVAIVAGPIYAIYARCKIKEYENAAA